MVDKFQDYAPMLIEQLPKGVFLTTGDDNDKNTMTIGWATVGRIWNKPMVVVAVRYTRHTYELLEKTKEFTVSIPIDDKMKEELKFCGTKSGRDFDKFSECNLAYQKGKEVNVPALTGCKYHYECKVVYQQAMEPAALNDELKTRFYKGNNDYHVLYYGEIVANYTI
jgi:flavin reductase (DIM6/NTAB) family NADH-FMN oxidoreductase RutF